MLSTTKRCDYCGITKPETRFKPHPDHPGERLATCRDCTPGTRIIRCTECGKPRRTKSHNARLCHVCALHRKLSGTAGMRPWKCAAPGCQVKFARFHKKDRSCAKHHAPHVDRATAWATGECRFCEVQSGFPIWAASVPACLGCLKNPDKREAILAWTRAQTPAGHRAHPQANAERTNRERVEREAVLAAHREAEAQRKAERAAEQAALSPEERERRRKLTEAHLTAGRRMAAAQPSVAAIEAERQAAAEPCPRCHDDGWVANPGDPAAPLPCPACQSADAAEAAA